MLPGFLVLGNPESASLHFLKADSLPLLRLSIKVVCVPRSRAAARTQTHARRTRVCVRASASTHPIASTHVHFVHAKGHPLGHRVGLDSPLSHPYVLRIGQERVGESSSHPNPPPPSCPIFDSHYPCRYTPISAAIPPSRETPPSPLLHTSHTRRQDHPAGPREARASVPRGSHLRAACEKARERWGVVGVG